VGSDIAFAPGAYQPGTAEGQKLLGHELAHVVQQSSQPPILQGKGLSGDSPEQEADRAAEAALSGEPVPPLTPIGESVQRQAAPSVPTAPAQLPKNPNAQPGELDLGKGMLDASTLRIQESGRVTARLGNLAVGEVELVQSQAGYSTKGNGSAIPLTLSSLGGLLAGKLMLVVRIQDNVITGYATPGKPGPARPRDDSALMGALTQAPEALGLTGLSKLGMKSLQNELQDGVLKLGTDSVDFTLSGFVTGSGQLHLDNDQMRFQGQAEVKLPGGSGGKLQVNWSPENGLAGETHLEVSLGKLSGGADARLSQGVLDIQGTAKYSGDRLQGTITLLATDEATARDITTVAPQAGGLPTSGGGGAAGAGAAAAPGASAPQAQPGPRAFCGWGELDFSLTEWLTGQVKVVVGSTGEATVRGEIAPPKEIILFEQKDWTKSLVKAEARAMYGIPVVGNVFVFANVGLEALASIGPGKLYNIKMSGQYSTDKRVDKELSLQASLNIPAFAGLRLRAEGGAGLEVLDHDVKLGVGIWALGGVRGYVEATPTIGYREKGGAPGEFYIKGHLDLAAQPFLALGGDLFIEVDSPFWSPLPDDKWTWPLGSLEYPLPGEFGLGAEVEHVLGSKQWPEIQLSEVEFDSSKFMSDLVSGGVPGRSKAGEDTKPGKWNDGGAGGAAAGGKGAGAKGASGANKGAAAGPKKAAVGGDKKGAGAKPSKGKGAEAKPGKDKPGKGKEKGGGAPGQVGESVSFSAKGQSYRLWVQVKGKSATLLVAKPQQNASAWIAAQENKLGNLPRDEKAQAHSLGGQARSLAASIDRQADRVAAGTGDKAGLQKANEQVKRDEHRLAGLLRQLAEFSGGEKGELTIGEPVAFHEGGKSHKLYFVRKGDDAVLMVASTPMTVRQRLIDFRSRLKGRTKGVGFFPDDQRRNKALTLLAQAEGFTSGLDAEADRLVRDHLRAKEAAPPSKENAQIVGKERSLASILEELYELFGENEGDDTFNMRAQYAGAAGHGELSLKPRSEEGKTVYVMVSGPLVWRTSGADRGRLVQELQALRQEFAEGPMQKLLPPSEPLRTHLDAVEQAAVQTQELLGSYLKSTRKNKTLPRDEVQAGLNKAAAAASQVARFKRVGAGELVERAVTAFASEKKTGEPVAPTKAVFEVAATLRRRIAEAGERVKQKEAEAQAQQEEAATQAGSEAVPTTEALQEVLQAQAPVKKGRKKKSQKVTPTDELKPAEPSQVEQEAQATTGTSPTAQNSGRKSTRGKKAAVYPGIPEDLQAAQKPSKKMGATINPAVVVSSKGPFVPSMGTYEEIQVGIRKAGGAFATDLLQVLHGLRQPTWLGKRNPERVDFKYTFKYVNKSGKEVEKTVSKERGQFLAELSVLFHVEMGRATAAWLFLVPRLLAANTAEEAAAAFTEDVFPHAMKGFMKEYRKQSSSLFDKASVTLFEDIQIKFRKEYGFEQGRHVFLEPKDIKVALAILREKMSELYDRATVKEESK
jgi:hypothetical protein